MSTGLVRSENQSPAEIMEKVVVGGDLSKLTPHERISYYKYLCDSLGLNSLTQPFAYISLQGKLVLYARKDCTDQLRKINHVSIVDMKEEERGDIYIVTAKAQDAKGRTDIAKGAVTLKGLSGEALANAIMKAETKAKRRVTLSLCGLGMLDETEVETIPGVRVERGGGDAQALSPAPDIDVLSDEKRAIENERERLRGMCREVFSELNAKGYVPKWTATTVNTYVNETFSVPGGLNALMPDSLSRLHRDLSSKLDVLIAEGDAEKSLSGQRGASAVARGAEGGK